MDTLQQAVGDSDKYLLELENGLSANQTANLVGTMLLLDYLFFEGGPPCELTANGVSVNCFNLYCCGCICPCKCEPGEGDA